MNRLLNGNLIELPLAVWASLAHMALYLAGGFALYLSSIKSGVIRARFQHGKAFLSVFFFMATLCWCSWLYAVLADRIERLPQLAIFSYNLAWVALSFITFILAYFAMSQPAVFQKLAFPRKYTNSPLSSRELDKLKEQLLQLMEAKMPYLDPQLNQQKLANLAGISSKNLSRLINERFEQHFFDFVNSYRIAEFQRISQLPENAHLTLLAMAYAAGFNSKTTFNTAFKKQTGITPSQFIKTQKTGSGS